MAVSNCETHTRGLQFVWVPEHACWVFVWSVDDGELDRNHRIAYSVVASPAEFAPRAGQFVLTQEAGSSDWTFVYGVPYHITTANGVVKVYFTDLTPALGWNRFVTGETSPDSTNAGKSGTKFGTCLEGQFSRAGINVGPVLWNLKAQAIHNNPAPVLEVMDVENPTANGPGAPSGVLVVEYQRDQAGRIKHDAAGLPLYAFIDSTETATKWTAQNFKIGYLALKFEKDYYGPGLHGWIGSSGASRGAFDFYSFSGGKLKLWPGTVNGLLPTNMFDELTVNTEGSNYVVLACTTDSNQVNLATLEIRTTAPTAPAAVLEAAPPTFDVLLGVILKNGDSYTVFKIWPSGFNIGASPRLLITTNKEVVAAFESNVERWYTWDVYATYLDG